MNKGDRKEKDNSISSSVDIPSVISRLFPIRLFRLTSLFCSMSTNLSWLWPTYTRAAVSHYVPIFSSSSCCSFSHVRPLSHVILCVFSLCHQLDFQCWTLGLWLMHDIGNFSDLITQFSSMFIVVHLLQNTYMYFHFLNFQRLRHIRRFLLRIISRSTCPMTQVER
jgi:hypothetical protein